MPPLTIMIKPVSSACNMRCRYCFYADVSSNREKASMGRMTQQTLENTVRRAMRYADGMVTFAFQGGEPTLAGVDFFREFVRLQKAYAKPGVRVMNSLQTNGYELSDEMIDFLAQEHFLVGVSYDGDAYTHDLMRPDAKGEPTSSRVEQTIARLQEKGVEFNILCVVNAHVARRPKEVFENLARFGYIQFISCLDPFDGTVSDYSLTAEDYTYFLKETFDLYYRAWARGKFVSVRNFDNYLGILAGQRPENCAMCGQCAQYYLLEADGGVYPCDFYVLDQWYMGNINDVSFFKLEKSPVSERFRQDSLHISPQCRQCKWYTLCRGGCRRDREPFENGLPVLNKWCACYRALFEYSLPRMQEMARGLFGR